MGYALFEAFVGHLPPSVNEMYVYTKRGPRPSAKMKRFKSDAKSDILRGLDFSKPPLDPGGAYCLEIDFFMPALYNKGWASGKAKTRFKRRDVSNLIKVAEDIVADVIGIDDSSFPMVSCAKFDSKECGSPVGFRVRVKEWKDI